MNDEICLLVCGGAHNKDVDRLITLLRKAGCTGKITARKVSPAALKRATDALEEVGRTEDRARNSSWR